MSPAAAASGSRCIIEPLELWRASVCSGCNCVSYLRDAEIRKTDTVALGLGLARGLGLGPALARALAAARAPPPAPRLPLRLVQQHVGRLDVAVDLPPRVHEAHGAAQLLHEEVELERTEPLQHNRAVAIEPLEACLNRGGCVQLHPALKQA